MDNFNKLRQLYGDLYKAKQRLYKAGLISKENVIDAAIKLADISIQIEDLKQKQNSVINQISLVVDKKLKNPYFEKFKKENIEKDIYLKNLPEISLYDKKIKSKKYQLKSEKSNYFPKIKFFGRYSMSNFNSSDYIRSVNDLRPVNWGIGFTVSFVLFDGYKTAHTVMQIKKEIEKLRLEKKLIMKQKEIEIKNDYIDMKHNKLKIKQIKEKIKNIAKNLENREKLYKIGKESKINIIQKQIDLINQKLDLKLSEIKNLYIAKKLKILKEFSLEYGTGGN
ncbi:TolC family protein [Persephonella sp.]